MYALVLLSPVLIVTAPPLAPASSNEDVPAVREMDSPAAPPEAPTDIVMAPAVPPSPEAVPVVGSPLVKLLRGGVSVGQGTLTRFYSAHTFVLPVAAAALMLTHFLMIRKQGISGPL